MFSSAIDSNLALSESIYIRQHDSEKTSECLARHMICQLYVADMLESDILAV